MSTDDRCNCEQCVYVRVVEASLAAATDQQQDQAYLDYFAYLAEQTPFVIVRQNLFDRFKGLWVDLWQIIGKRNQKVAYPVSGTSIPDAAKPLVDPTFTCPICIRDPLDPLDAVAPPAGESENPTLGSK